MASVKITLGSVLNTVNATANTVTGLVDSLSASVGMLNTRVQAEAFKQQEDIKYELNNYSNVALGKAVMANTDNDIELERYMKQSPEHRQLFEKHWKLLTEQQVTSP